MSCYFQNTTSCRGEKALSSTDILAIGKEILSSDDYNDCGVEFMKELRCLWTFLLIVHYAFNRFLNVLRIHECESLLPLTNNVVLFQGIHRVSRQASEGHKNSVRN